MNVLIKKRSILGVANRYIKPKGPYTLTNIDPLCKLLNKN